MPTTRSTPHLVTRMNGISPAQVGDALLTPQIMAEGTESASATSATSNIQSTPIKYNTVARLTGSWYADLEHIGLKHYIRFERDGTGFLRTLCQIGETELKYAPFIYTFDVTTQQIKLRFRELTDAEGQNPVLSQSLHQEGQDDDVLTQKLHLQAQQLQNGLLRGPSNQSFKPTERLDFDCSPWPGKLFPETTSFVGRFASMSFRHQALVTA